MHEGDARSDEALAPKTKERRVTHAITSVEEYIASAPEAVRPILNEIRRLFRAAVPEGRESIRYGMPAVALGDGYRLYFAAWKKHVGIYPIATLNDAFETELAPYRSGKDSVRFPLSVPIPYPLIERLVGVLAAKHSPTDERLRTPSDRVDDLKMPANESETPSGDTSG